MPKTDAAVVGRLSPRDWREVQVRVGRGLAVVADAP
jgi:hypothetical protein